MILLLIGLLGCTSVRVYGPRELSELPNENFEVSVSVDSILPEGVICRLNAPTIGPIGGQPAPRRLLSWRRDFAKEMRKSGAWVR